MIDLDATNWINLGLLAITGIVGVLSWRGARQAAKEAHTDQQAANLAAVRSASAAEQANTIQKRLVEIEEKRERQKAVSSKKAILTAAIQRSGDKSSYALIVSNRGACPAKDIEVFVNDQPLNDWKEFLTKIPEDCKIGPGGTFQSIFLLFRAGKLMPPYHVILRWSDESSARRGWESTLT
jgi:hypothetical protein